MGIKEFVPRAEPWQEQANRKMERGPRAFTEVTVCCARSARSCLLFPENSSLLCDSHCLPRATLILDKLGWTDEETRCAEILCRALQGRIPGTQGAGGGLRNG